MEQVSLAGGLLLKESHKYRIIHPQLDTIIQFLTTMPTTPIAAVRFAFNEDSSL
jgi:hypothetical protein